MGKKKTSKKAKPKSINKEKEKEATEEKPFEYGGLPNRDLKKNLGCG
jgi:hypothetical protein